MTPTPNQSPIVALFNRLRKRRTNQSGAFGGKPARDRSRPAKPSPQETRVAATEGSKTQ